MGCARAAWINRGKDGVGGIPFFVKRAVYRQTTVYEVYWLEVTLDIIPPDPKDPRSGQLVARALVGSPELDQLRTTIVDATVGVSPPKVTPGYDQIIQAFDKVQSSGKAIDTYRPPTANDVVSNSLSQVAIVDYSTPYYLNGPLPWFGSTKVNAELNTDGTLSKGGVEPETKLAEGISTLLPVKEFLSGKFVPAAAVVGAAAEGQKFAYKLTISPKGYSYTVTADFSEDPCANTKYPTPCPLKPLTKTADSQWVRAPLDAPSGDKKSDSNAINFSGSVTLPKPDQKEP
jgi:hypothetical protein